MTTKELKQMKLSELIETKERQLKQIIKLSKQITEVTEQDLKKEYANTDKINHKIRLIKDYCNNIALIDNYIQYIREY